MHFITTTAPTHTRTETALSELFMLTQRRRAHLDTQTRETQTQSSGGASSTDWTHRRTWLVCFAPPGVKLLLHIYSSLYFSSDAHISAFFFLEVSVCAISRHELCAINSHNLWCHQGSPFFPSIFNPFKHLCQVFLALAAFAALI